jgi:hypothetical protein
MLRLRVLLGVIVVLVSNVAATRTIQTQPVTSQASSVSACPVTEPVQAVPANDPNADPFGSGPWYINADRSMWAIAGHWVEGPQGNKVLWIRPQGTNLKVVGRRLDGDGAMALKADIPCCYPTGFQASRVYFPTSGCWEVTATAGGSELKFVTKVS